MRPELVLKDSWELKEGAYHPASVESLGAGGDSVSHPLTAVGARRPPRPTSLFIGAGWTPGGRQDRHWAPCLILYSADRWSNLCPGHCQADGRAQETGSRGGSPAFTPRCPQSLANAPRTCSTQSWAPGLSVLLGPYPEGLVARAVTGAVTGVGWALHGENGEFVRID